MSRDWKAPRAAVSDTTGCETCQHCSPSMLFTTCTHVESAYYTDGRVEFHTIQHMRDIHAGLCGEDKRLWKAKA